jgi:lipopolysaccharide/colanic/teichoic acid biosynthesis glycosyltransferase
VERTRTGVIKKDQSLCLSPSSSKRTYLLLKRGFDLAFSPLALVLAAPLMFVIAVAIKLDSKGPALLKQERIGKGGVPFGMYKFRTMVNESSPLGPKPLSLDDRRITRVGRFLRRSSLDELPQLVNVLKGDMSLVGPRPELPFLVARYEPWQRKRLDVLPGITGWWQVSGRKQPMHDHVDYDLYYVYNQSFRLDLIILCKTLFAVISGEGVS